MAEMKQENASLKGTSRGLTTMLEKMRKRRESYPTIVEAFEVLCGWILATYLLVTGKNLQKPASKCLLEMLHNTTKFRKKIVFYAEIFHIKSPNECIVYVTYLR